MKNKMSRPTPDACLYYTWTIGNIPKPLYQECLILNLASSYLVLVSGHFIKQINKPRGNSAVMNNCLSIA
jgi:hypothetical protein